MATARRSVVFALLALVAQEAACLHAGIPLPSLARLRTTANHRMMANSDKREEELIAAEDLWEFREEFSRGLLGTIVNWKEEEYEEELQRAQRRADGEDAGESASKSAFAASAAAVVIGALVIRLGGRAALVSVLGLDLVSELGIGDQIDQIVGYADAAGAWTLVAFFAAWVVAKVFLIDVISIALAFSSGVLFGGVFEGALVSAVGATLGSLTSFGLSRTLLQDRVEKATEKQPVARALAKVVEQDGFKTVFVLRLSPILPIPLGTYPYIYGTSKLNPLIFAGATFLGSLKPYLLDSYLGLFAKQIVDGDSLDDSRDLILLVGLGALVLVGVFATELANESWELVQQEVKAEEKAKQAADALLTPEERAAQAAAEAQGEPLMIGPFNATAAQERAVGLIPAGVRAEADTVWRAMEEYLDAQWEPAARYAVAERAQREEERLKTEASFEALLNGTPEAGGGSAGSEGGNMVERFLASLATPAEDDGAAAAAPPLDFKARTAEELAARRRQAEWSLEGAQPWRQLLESLFFSFALMGVARGRWVAYDAEEVAALVREPPTSAAGDSPAQGGPPAVEADPSSPPVPAVAPNAAGVAATTEVLDAAAATAQTFATRRAAATEQARETREALATRQTEISTRLAEIEARLESLAGEAADRN